MEQKTKIIMKNPLVFSGTYELFRYIVEYFGLK